MHILRLRGGRAEVMQTLNDIKIAKVPVALNVCLELSFAS